MYTIQERKTIISEIEQIRNQVNEQERDCCRAGTMNIMLDGIKTSILEATAAELPCRYEQGQLFMISMMYLYTHKHTSTICDLLYDVHIRLMQEAYEEA